MHLFKFFHYRCIVPNLLVVRRGISEYGALYEVDQPRLYIPLQRTRAEFETAQCQRDYVCVVNHFVSFELGRLLLIFLKRIRFKGIRFINY